jgi:hypothetical protein
MEDGTACGCVYCIDRTAGRKNFETGDSRGIKRSPGASPPSKKVMLVESGNKVSFRLLLPV